jgi:hypothetical protein
MQKEDDASSADDGSSTKLDSGASEGGVVYSSGSRDQAISAVKSLLSKVHVGGSFRIVNSKAEFSKAEPYPYFYLACKGCRDAKCGVWQKGGGPAWTVKSVSTALGSACAVGQTSGTSAVGSASTLAETLLAAGKMAAAAMEAVDVQQLVQAVVSPAKVACTHCTTPTEEGSLARCGNGTHVFCGNCFSLIVSDAVRGQNQGVCIAAKGLVPCNYCKPKSAFDIQRFSALLSTECFTDWLDVMAAIRMQAVNVHQFVQDASPAKFKCDECKEDFDEGAQCGSGTHRFCSNCFSLIVSDAVRGQNQGVCIAAKGLVPCNYCKPKSAFDIQKFSALLSTECFSAWLEVVTAIRVREEADRWLEREKNKEREHFEALDRAGAVTDDMRVRRHYGVISETLIQPSCPVCHKYIVEFDACCALQCGRRDGYVWTPGSGCGAFICAWCLETKPEKELHDHVLLCDYNPVRNSMYPPPGHPVAWTKVMNEFARMRVRKYIGETVEERLREQVFTEVQTNNPGIGLALQTWGTDTSDGYRPSRLPRPPVRPSFEANITTLLDMQLADTRAQALDILEGARGDLDLAVTFAMAQRMDR